MGATIDDLQIKLQGDSKSANKEIDTVIKNLQNLSTALGGFRSVPGLQSVTKVFNEMKTATNGVDAGKIKAVSSSIRSLASSIVSLQSVSSNGFGLNRLREDIKGLESIKFDTSGLFGITNLANNIGKIGSKTGTTATGNLIPLADNLKRFVTEMNGAQSLAFDAESLSRLASSISKIGGIKVSNATTTLPQLTSSLKTFVTEMNKVEGVSFNTEGLLNLANSISRLGSKTSSVAVENIPKLKDAINSLLSDLSKAPAISDNTVRSLEAMANIAQRTGGSFNRANSGITVFTGNTVSNFDKIKNAASKVVSAFGKVAVAAGKVTGINRILNGVQRLVPASNQAQSGIKGLAMKFGTLYASAFMVTRVFGKFKGAIESAMDYVETYDYFRAAFNQVAANADLSKWKELGYKSAEEYANSFEERAKAVTKQLSGFEITESGALLDTGTKSLGLNPKSVMDTQALFGQMSSSMGVASDTATKLSRVLTEIGGDLASVKNMSFGDVWENLSSGLVGMSRAVDKYGVNIRNANMQQELMKLGINANITKLSQQDKALLRTIIILNSTKYAWGNLADTINSPANSIRIFQENMASVSRTLGSIFLPVISKVMPYVNGLAIAIRRLVEYIAKLLGVDMSDYMKGLGGGSGNEMLSDALDAADEANDTADAVDNIGKSADKAAKKQKKFNKQLQAFDELNNLTTTETEKNPKTSTPKASTSGIPNVTDELTAALDDALSKYQKVWDKAYKRMQNKAEDIANKIQKAFKRAWTTGSGYELGKTFAGWLNKGINWWNKHLPTFASTSKKIAGILATAVNGAIWNLNWKGLGKAIGGSIKAYLDANTHFFDTVQWEKLGRGLADSLNAFVDSGVIESYFANIGSKIRAVIETLFGFSEGFDFSNLGTAIGKGLNEILGKMNKKINGLSGWEKLGKTVSNLVKGALDTGIAFLTTFKWEKLGKGISKAITSVDFKGIAIKLTNFSVAIFNAVTKFLGGVSWFKVGQKIGDFIGNIGWGKIAWNFAKLAGAVVKAIAGAFVGSLSKAPIETAIVGLFAVLKWTGLGKSMFTSLASKIVGSIGEAISVSANAGLISKITGFLSSALSAGAAALPYVAVAAAIGGMLVGAWKQVSKKQIIPTIDMSKAQKSYGDLKDSINEVETAINNTKEAIKNTTFDQDWSGQDKALEDLAKEYKDLNKKAKDLGGTTKLTASEQEKLKILSQKMIEQVPTLKGKIDTTTGAYKGTWKQLQKNVEETKRLYKLQAAQEDLEKNYKQQYENEKALTNAKEAKRKAEEDYNKTLKEVERQNNEIYKIQKYIDKYGEKRTKDGKGDMTYDRINKLQKDALKNNKSLKLSEQGILVVKNSQEKALNKAIKKVEKLESENENLKKSEKEISGYIDKNSKSYVTQIKTIKQLAKEAKNIKQINLAVKTDSKSQKQVEKFKDLLDKSNKNSIINVIAKAKETGDYSKIADSWKGFKDKAKKVLTAYMSGKLDKKSAQDVIDAWESIPEDAKKTLEAQLKGKELQDFKDLQAAYNEIKNKEVKVDVKSGTVDTSKVDEAIKKFQNRSLSLDVRISSGESAVRGIDEKIRKLNKKKIVLETRGDLKGAKKIQDEINRLKKQKIKIQTEIALNKQVKKYNEAMLHAGKPAGMPTADWNKFVESAKAANSLPTYAKGGFPKMGEIFIANEAGPELVGKINNKNAVAPQDDIAKGISDAVFNVLNPLMTRMANAIVGLEQSMNNANSGNTLSVEGVSDGDIVRIVKNEDTAYRRRTGRGMFA